MLKTILKKMVKFKILQKAYDKLYGSKSESGGSASTQGSAQPTGSTTTGQSAGTKANH
jgi:hypothetical protein